MVIISRVKYLSTGDLTMASFGLSCFIFSHQKKQTSWFLSLSKYQACAKLKQRLYISKELDKYSQVDPNGNDMVWEFSNACLWVLKEVEERWIKRRGRGRERSENKINT